MFDIVRILDVMVNPKILARGYNQRDTVDTAMHESEAMAIAQSLTAYPDCPYPCHYEIVGIPV